MKKGYLQITNRVRTLSYGMSQYLTSKVMNKTIIVHGDTAKEVGSFVWTIKNERLVLTPANTRLRNKFKHTDTPTSFVFIGGDVQANGRTGIPCNTELEQRFVDFMCDKSEKSQKAKVFKDLETGEYFCNLDELLAA